MLCINIAIWSDKAKQQMYDWAIKAKLINGNIKDQLKIVYEPDCASLSLQHAITKNIDMKDDSKNGLSNPTDLSNDNKDNNDADDDRYIIKSILKGINLLQYYDRIIDEGCTTIDEVRELTKDDLKNDLKINKLPHRNKIFKAFQNYNNSNICQELCPTIDIDVNLKTGDKYILIDVGGGTCDFACHKIEKKFVISELFHPSGGDWGSINIDRIFSYYIDEIFGIKSHNILTLKTGYNDGRIAYLELLSKFEKAKKDFGSQYSDNLDDYHFDIELPYNFVTYLVDEWDRSNSENNNNGLKVVDTIDKLTDHLKTKKLWNRYQKDGKKIKPKIDKLDVNKITQFGIGDQDAIYDTFVEIKRVNDKYILSLHYNLWFIMFNEIIEPIINHCNKLLKMDELRDIKYIFLVGGFSASKYFQNYIKKYYKNIKIVIPNLPGLCVVDGASKYGLDPHFVKIRKMPKHYGISTKCKKSIISSDIPAKHIQNNTFVYDGTMYVENLFGKIINKNESILFDTPKIRRFNKSTESSTSIRIGVYSSAEDNPLTIYDCDELGSFHIPMSKGKQKIMVEFIFGQTILTVYAYETGKNKKKMEIDYHRKNV